MASHGPGHKPVGVCGLRDRVVRFRLSVSLRQRERFRRLFRPILGHRIANVRGQHGRARLRATQRTMGG